MVVTRRRLRVVVLALAVVLAACGGGNGAGEGAGPAGTASTTVVTTATTAAGPGGGPRLDWTTRKAVDVDGWSVRACEGDGPFYCVSERGTIVGVVELAEFPLSSFDALRGRSRSEALDWVAADADRRIREDRERGCPPGSRYETIPPTHPTVAGDRGVRFGFTVTSPGGAAAERSLTYATIVGEELVLTTAAAFGEGSCVSAEGPQFRPSTLRRFEPVLDRLVADMVLPR